MVQKRSQMSHFAFDTHAFVKHLTQAGMDEQQAEALVECQVQLSNDSLASKQDIEEVKLDIEEVKRDIQEVKLDIEEVKRDIQAVKKDIAALKTGMQKMELRLTLRLGSVIIVTMGVFATLVRFIS